MTTRRLAPASAEDGGHHPAGSLAGETCAEFPIRSSVSGEQFRVLMWRSEDSPSAGGFPCLYTFDGDDHFAMLATQAASMAAAGLMTPVIVGIGYCADARTVERRIYDLTPSAVRYEMPERPNGAPWPKLGGGGPLLETIERDIKPLVAKLCGRGPSTTTLFGHSLGGLMVLHALSTGAGNYDRYFASSPSIWFNGRKIIDDLATRLDMPFPRPIVLRIAVGGAEEDLANKSHGPDADPILRAAWVANNRMVGNARDLARVIQQRGLAELDFAFDEFPGANHRSVLSFAILKALDCASMR